MVFFTLVMTAVFAQSEAAPPPEAFVPFQAARGRLTIPISFNGNGPYAFLIDSGSEHLLLDPGTATALGIPSAVGTQVALINIDIGASRVPQAAGEVIDLAPLRNTLGMPVAGVLPARLADAALSIRFSRGQVAYLHANAVDTRQYEYGAALLPAEGCPEVLVSVNRSKKYKARLDLAYAGTLAVPKSLAREMGLLNPSVPRIRFEAPPGEAAAAPHQALADLIEMGGAELRQALCTIKDGDDVPVLGTGFLKHFDVVFDFAEDRLLLKPLSASPSGDESTVAYGVVPGNRKDGCWTLLVALNSPAFRAGVKSGDCLKAINGDDMQDKPFEEVSRRLAGAPGRSIRLTVLRGGEPRDFTLAAEPLLQTEEARP